jgi:hypothetical protein
MLKKSPCISKRKSKTPHLRRIRREKMKQENGTEA